MAAPVYVLASKSAIRATLLRNAGLSVELQPALIDERAVEAPWVAAGTPPDTVARLLAVEKARDVSGRNPARLVIGADQTLAVGNDRLSKAVSREAAAARIRRLAGRTHALHSGFAVVHDGEVLASGVSTALLTMRPLDEPAIAAYLAAAGDAILGSVGCYQLEGIGVRLFERVEGDYFTVLGLPVVELLGALRGLGLMGEAW
jgi:septum formation protein